MMIDDKQRKYLQHFYANAIDHFPLCNDSYIFVSLSQGFLSTACLAMVSLQVAKCQDPVNLELLLSDAQVRSGQQQQQPNIEQLLSAARVQEGQQLGPNAPLAAQIPVVKANVIPDTLGGAGQDNDNAGEVRKFRPRLLRQRLRQTLTNLKNRESIIPLPSTVAPQEVTQTTPTPRQVMTCIEKI